MSKFEEYYSRCFDSSSAAHGPEHEIIKEEVDKNLENLKNIKYNINFTQIQINSVIAQLNKGKAFGYDSVSAEMLIYACPEVISPILAKFYSVIFNQNLIPTDFNVSMVTPIPKSTEIPKHPKNFRPVSVSTVFANVFELLLLNNVAGTLQQVNCNQFGYLKNISCKHAYFVLNECVHLYNLSRLKVEIAQLDAEKAFDTLWRVRLYNKLMNVVDPVYFRVLVTYYDNSQ